MSDVLGIAPHPDDLELSAGGTVAGLVQSGHSVVFVDLTEGERGTRGTREIRRREAEAAAAVLGLAGRETLGFPDGGLNAHDRSQLETAVDAVRRHRPKLVLTMHENDEHPDHQEAAMLVRRAVYLAGLKNWPRENSTPHRIQSLLFAMGRRSFDPSLIVNIENTYVVKRKAMAAYHSQLHRDLKDPNVTPISEPGFLKALEARDRYHGSIIGAEFGEAFWSDRPWALPAEALVRP